MKCLRILLFTLIGKRSCVAESFARKTLFLYFVTILQKFSISIVDCDDPFDEEFNLTVRPKGKVKLIFQMKNIETDVK